MTTPVPALATPDDLRMYLGAPEVDTDRASLLLTLAEAAAGTVVSPLPGTARFVILDVAARAYVNPEAASSSSVGSLSSSFGAGGIYLTAANRRDLERAAGIGGGAFSVNTAPDAGKGYRDPLAFPAEDLEEIVYDEFPAGS